MNPDERRTAGAECKRLADRQQIPSAAAARRRCWPFVSKALRLRPAARDAVNRGDCMSKSSRSNGPALNRRELLRLSTAFGVGAVMPTSGAFADMTGGSVRGPRGHVQHAAVGRREDAIREGARLCRGRRADLQRRPVRREHRRREPVAPGQAARRRGTASIPALIYGANCPQRLHNWSSEQTFL